MKHFVLFSAFAILIFSSCSDAPKQKYQPESIGAVNTLTVVMEDALWKGAVGDAVREKFAAPVVGLVWSDEPLFTINYVPTKVFKGALKQTRAILLVAVDTVTVGHVKNEVYARPQKVGVIKAATESLLIDKIEEEADAMITAFKSAEIVTAQKRFLRSISKETALRDRFGFELTMPSMYKVGKKDSNFVWIDRQIQRGTLNMIAYTVPGDYFKADSTLVQDIIGLRDSIGERYIPGPDVPNKKTFMITEKAFAPNVFPAEINGFKGVEVRGIWEISGYAMAGPYLMYILNDTANDRKIVLEGFTFAPSAEKRDYMFELEAILKTIKPVSAAN